MRHGKKLKKFGVSDSYRKALLHNMATSLIIHKRIKTTLAKAKAARIFSEKLITKVKDDSVHSRRMISRFIKDKEAVKTLFAEIAPKIADRPGGYTRIVKLGQRIGDGAQMAILELVDFNESVNLAKAEHKEKREQAKENKEKNAVATPAV